MISDSVLSIHVSRFTLHVSRFTEAMNQSGYVINQRVFQVARTHKSVVCEVARGGLLAMRPLLIHSSSKGQTGDSRRVLHIEYSDSLELTAGIRLAVA